jgi:hypothetical protein
VCSINMKDRARGDTDGYTPPCDNPSHHPISTES